MGLIQIDAKQLIKAMKGLEKWADKGARADVDRATTDMTKDYKARIHRGVDGANNRIRAVKEVTMDMPIRISSDKAIRRDVNSSKRALVARGNAVNSIKKRQVNKHTTEILPTTKHGKKVFAFNANNAKTKRDPLIVSDIQGKMLEKELLEGIDKAIRS